MRKLLAAFALAAVAAAGCAPALDSDERALLHDIFRGLEPMGSKYAEFEGFPEGVEQGPNFVSYTHEFGKGHAMPLGTPAYFWVKVSLAKDAVEPVDLQPPLLTVYVPRFKKYLKFRLVSANEPLVDDLKSYFFRAASDAGGTDPHWDVAQGPMNRFGRRVRRTARL